MPIQYWTVKDVDDAPTHIGPMAQDFYAAFGMGDSEKTIATIDLDGVALAGVKALDERTRGQEERLAALEAELARGVEGETGQAAAPSPGGSAGWQAAGVIVSAGSALALAVVVAAVRTGRGGW